MQIPHVPGFAKRLVAQVMDDDVPEVAAGLAYRFLFAIFPFAIFLAALAGFVAPAIGLGDPTDEIIGGLSDNLPPDVAAQLRPQIEAVLGTSRPGLLSIGAVLALWAATGGVGAVIKGMNRAYDVEETRGFVRSTAVALGITVLGSIGILVAFVTIVGGSIITEQAANAIGIGGTAWAAASLLRFPLVLVLVSLAVAVLFKLGPNVSVSFRWTLAGGVVFAVTWLIGTVLFGLYVANFGSYSNTYGALGGVVVLMLWFYLTGLALLVAAEVTSLLAKEREPHVIAARRDTLKASAPRTAGRVAGVAVGVAKAATEADGAAADAAATGADDTAADERRRGREPETAPGTRLVTRRPGPEPGTQVHAAARRSSAAFVAVVLGVGALAGAILGRLTGDDDEGGAASGSSG